MLVSEALQSLRLRPGDIARVDRLPDIKSTPYGSWGGSAVPTWLEVFRDHETYRIRFNRICDFVVGHDGQEPRCLVMGQWPIEDVLHLFDTHVAPLILSLGGNPAFHGSCVAVDGAALVFMGETGRGKSTLAASFASNGYAFLTDDLLIVEQGVPPVVHPHNDNVRLWRHSILGLFPPDQEMHAYSSYTSKRRLNAGETLLHHGEPAQLAAAFVLSEATPEVRCRRLNGREAHRVWMKNMFVLDPERTDALRGLFDASANIAGQTPTYELSYPQDFALLPTVRRKILEIALAEGTAA